MRTSHLNNLSGLPNPPRLDKRLTKRGSAISEENHG
jgi:hypothetical protein